MDEITKDRFDVNNNEHREMIKQMEGANKKIDGLAGKMVDFELNITKQIGEIPIQLQKEFDKRYASKETETTVKRVQWLVISSVIVALLGLVIIDKVF